MYCSMDKLSEKKGRSWDEEMYTDRLASGQIPT